MDDPCVHVFPASLCPFCNVEIGTITREKTQQIDHLVLRMADLLNELGLMTQRRADALRIAEERRERVQKLEGKFGRVLDVVHAYQAERGVPDADGAITEVAEILEEE